MRPLESRIARRIDREVEPPPAWDVFASCNHFYWNKSGKSAREQFRNGLPRTIRAVIGVGVDEDRLPEFLDMCSPHNVLSSQLLGWVSNGDKAHVLLSVDDPVSSELIQRLLRLPGVMYLEPDSDRTALMSSIKPSDSIDFDPVCQFIAPRKLLTQRIPALEEQAALQEMRLDLLNDEPGDAEPVVAIIDDGLLHKQRYVAPHLWYNEEEVKKGPRLDGDNDGLVNDTIGWDFYGRCSDPLPDSDSVHGTKVAGLITAIANQAGISVKLMALRIDGESRRLSLDRAARAVNYAVKHGAQVIVIAKTWKLKDSKLEELVFERFRAAVANARDKALIVCAAGNLRKNIEEEKIQPALLGVESDGCVLTVQGFGPAFSASNVSPNHPDAFIVAAGGDNVRSVAEDPPQAVLFHKTSSATAIVAGVAAVVAAKRGPFQPVDLKKRLLACRKPDAESQADKLLNLTHLPD